MEIGCPDWRQSGQTGIEYAANLHKALVLAAAATLLCSIVFHFLWIAELLTLLEQIDSGQDVITMSNRVPAGLFAAMCKQFRTTSGEGATGIDIDDEERR